MYDNNFKIIKVFLFVSMFSSLGATFNIYAQDKKKVDSLTQLMELKQGVDLIDILLPLSSQYSDIDNTLALRYAHRANDLALELGDSLRIVKSGRIIGQLQRRLGNLEESKKMLLQIRPIAKRNKFLDEDKRILNALAIAYTFEANYNEALKYNFESLIIREHDGNLGEISISLNNIGLVYFKLKNYQKALEFYERSLAAKREGKVTSDLDRLLVNIGLCYNQLSNYSEAHNFFSEGFAVCGDKCGDAIKMEGKFGLGVSYYGMRKYEEAIQNFKQSFELAKKLQDKRFQAENLIYLSHIHVEKKEFDDAINTLTTTEELAKSSGLNELLIETYKEFSQVYNQLRDFEKSSHFQALYIGIKDSIYGVDLIKNLGQTQTQYEERENLAIIADKEEIIQQQARLSLAILVIAVLATLLIFVLYRSNRTKKRVNQQLSDAKSIIEEQNRKLLSSNFSLNQELKQKNIELQKVNESLLRVNEEP